MPAYFAGGIGQLTDPSTGYDWTRVANAGSYVLAVVPDASFSGGHLSGSCDSSQPDYCGPCSSPCAGAYGLCAAKCQFVTNHSVNQLVLGYVYTNFACDTTSTPESVMKDVRGWYQSYPTQIQGVFYDVGPTLSTCGITGNKNNQPPVDEATQQFDYDQVYQYAKGTYTGKVMLNASQFKNEWVMSDPVNGPAADYAVTFEHDYSHWVNNYYADQNNNQPASWWTSASYHERLAHVIFSDGAHPTQLDVASAVNPESNSDLRRANALPIRREQHLLRPSVMLL